MKSSLYETNLSSLTLLGRGKVRDIYDLGNDLLLIVATDRLSAFDVVFAQVIPGKGEILTKLSNFWFTKMSDIVPNHLTHLRVADYLNVQSEYEELKDRSVVVKKLRPLPFEAVVRGYVAGSGWEDYSRTGSICGITPPGNLRMAERLKSPIFTPSTKANIGEHDENISFQEVQNLIGIELADKVRTISIEIYEKAAKFALDRGIIIADTKMEFGLSSEGELILIDELLTPDSSRFWPLNSYEVGKSPESYDKQFIRDYLEKKAWDKSPPAPELPIEIVDKTLARYRSAYDYLVG
jgi:phosphoribosylaminoimidazole-succinocarboxamide synthase